MPLWMSSHSGSLDSVWCGLGDDLVDLANDVTLEAADRFAARFPFGDAAGEVVAGAGIPTKAGQGDAIKGGVGLAVAAPVEAAAMGLA
jgi:hypothetical protein